MRGEYIEAAVNLRRAIAEATEAGLLGKNIMGTGFDSYCQLQMEEFPSGQRGQTVNLLRYVSVVRIHPPPPYHLENEPHPLGWGSFFYAMLHQNQISRAEMPLLSCACIFRPIN